MTPLLHIRLFGGLQITQGETPVGSFISNKVPALLAYLAVTQRPHQRDALAALLWGDMSDADAKNNLRQALSNLRKLLEPHLLINRDTVEWNTAVPYTLDVQQFERCWQDDPAQAAALYRGDFLAGFVLRDAPDFEEWMLMQRARFRERALYALHNLTQVYLERAEYGRVIDLATQLLTIDPWREEAYRQLMLALARSGQHVAALQQYETCRRLLEKELGVQPSAETITLVGRIRDARRSARHNLPAATTPFVGREAELADLRHRLINPTCRLLTLTGPGGIGKTRLALEVAAACQTSFLNGICFVSLASLDANTPAPSAAPATLSALIDALALKLAGPNNPRQQLIAYLRGKEMLLLLDNLEHLLEQTAWLHDLLQQAPDVKLLVTSRERLNLSGEWVVELEGLPVPAVLDPVITPTGAGQLFVTQAQRVRANFAVTAVNAPAIQRICQMVGGLPLGIELAAAWVHSLSCAEIAQEIAGNLDFLATTRRDMPTRQRSLRAVFDHSWQLFTPTEQQAFAALSIFHGSFSPEAARSVTQMTLPVLASLLDKSLLRRQPNGRYEFHELLRQYADQQLSPETRQRLHARHAEYFAHWLHQQQSRFHTPQEADAFQAIITDHDNVRAGWHWAIAGQRLDLLALALDALRIFYTEQGRYQEGIDLMDKAAVLLGSLTTAQPDDAATRHLLGKVWARQAAFCLWGGQRAAANTLFQQALPIIRHFADPAELGLLLLGMAYFAVLGGDYAQAQTQFLESLAYYRQAGEISGVADALSALGAVSNITGAWDQAREYLEESVALSRQMDDEHGLRTSLVNLGNVFYYHGDYLQAKAYYREVLALCQKAGDRSAEAVTLCNLGLVAYDSADYVAAETCLQQGVQIFQEINSLHFLIQGQANLGGVHVALGRYDLARAELQWALQKALTEQLHHLSPVVVFEVGRYFDAMGQAGEALALYYWVVANPTTTAEQKRDAGKRLPILEAQLGVAQVRQVYEYAQTLDETAVLSLLASTPETSLSSLSHPDR